MIQIRYEVFNTERFMGADHAKRIGAIGVRLVIKEKGAPHPMEVMPEVGGASRAAAVRKARRTFGLHQEQFYRSAETVFVDARPRQLQRVGR